MRRLGRSGQFTAILALFAAAAWPQPAVSQPGCNIREERKAGTLTAVFSAGSTDVRLTLPARLYHSDTVTAFLEVSGRDSDGPRPDLLLETGGEKVPVTNGAAVQIFPIRRRRLQFSLTNGSGDRPCSWQPSIWISESAPPQMPEGIREAGMRRSPTVHEGFRNAGDPILVEVGGPPAAFRIDGASMTVLARTSTHVVLRDPHPQAGLRILESRGYSVTLPFVALELEVAAPASTGRGSLEIRVTGRDRIPLAALPKQELLLLNFSPERLRLSCGRSYQANDGDWEERRFVSLRRDRNGDLRATCRIEIRQPGPVSLDGIFHEMRVLPRLRSLWPRGIPLGNNLFRSSVSD